MIKNAKLEVGKTPSMLSGRKSTKIDKGEALADNEKLPEDKVLEKVAKMIDTSSE